MKKIVLFCGAGMSSSLLVLKVRDAIKAGGYDYTCYAYDTSTVISKSVDADVVLVAPQVRHMLKKYQAAITNCPVEPMDMVSYGSMNGPKILAQARQLMGEE
jgi:cellobiose PTS system EIIB component